MQSSTYQYDFDVDALWAYLRKIFAERIVILDGAMGTEIQKYKLQEEDYRGDLFKDVIKQLKNNNDLLVLSQPHII